MNQSSSTVAARAGAREWLGLAVLALPTLLLSLDVTVLHLGVPRLSEDLQPTSAQLLWIVDIYGFMIAGFLVTMGAVGDRIGRRRLLLVGAAAFTVASASAAFSITPEMLIASRAVMGIAGATLMPSTLALISNMFLDPQQRGMAIGIWATMFSAGIALGPIVGGALLEHFWWGSVFLLGVPVMLVLLVAAPFLLPEHRDRAVGRPDLLSVALIIACMLTITFSIKDLASHGLAAPAVAIGAVGLLLGVLFIRRQNRLADPLLDLRLFRSRALRAGLVAMLISTLAIGGIYLFLTQYLQLVADHSPLVTGLLLLPAALALIVTSLLAPVLARRIHPLLIVAVALAVSATGFIILASVVTTADTPLILIGFAVAYAGIGPVTALGTDLVVGSAPAERAGAASALSETSTEIGVSVGIAAMGSLGIAIYRAGLADGSDGGAAAGAYETAKETLATALEAAGDLPAEAAAALTRAATVAFTAGFAAAAWLGAALLVLASVLTIAARWRADASAGASATRRMLGA
ncbi:MFS transporter [Microbacterium sp.]|uniref:MFS transporter n=1 Tax=Microbacterium sp. TaxID=51671 RepID=UPI002811FD71|nr:MFS transporter [Microbacterium sp.]